MFDLNKIKGIIFDYGGTIDSNGMHWAEVLWKAYQEVKVPVSYEVFRDAYVHGERTLARVPIIKPEHTFLDVLKLKTEIQINWLIENGFLVNENKSFEYSLAISNLCYTFVRDVHK
ncbi:MAG: HAD family hydrolase, partial [Tannerellaceae bacterium]